MGPAVRMPCQGQLRGARTLFWPVVMRPGACLPLRPPQMQAEREERIKEDVTEMLRTFFCQVGDVGGWGGGASDGRLAWRPAGVCLAPCGNAHRLPGACIVCNYGLAGARRTGAKA